MKLRDERLSKRETFSVLPPYYATLYKISRPSSLIGVVVASIASSLASACSSTVHGGGSGVASFTRLGEIVFQRVPPVSASSPHAAPIGLSQTLSNKSTAPHWRADLCRFHPGREPIKMIDRSVKYMNAHWQLAPIARS